MITIYYYTPRVVYHQVCRLNGRQLRRRTLCRGGRWLCCACTITAGKPTHTLTHGAVMVYRWRRLEILSPRRVIIIIRDVATIMIYYTVDGGVYRRTPPCRDDMRAPYHPHSPPVIVGRGPRGPGPAPPPDGTDDRAGLKIRCLVGTRYNNVMI